MMSKHSMHRLLNAQLCLSLVLVFLTLRNEARASGPPITALAFDPSQTELLVGSQAGVQTYSWPELKAGTALNTEQEQVHDIAFSPDGKLLAIASGTPGETGSLEIWNWPKREKLAAHHLHADVIYQQAFRGDSKRLFTASHDGGVFEVEPISGNVVREFTGHSGPVRSLCLVDNDKTLVTAGNDQTIRVWDTATGKLLRSLHNHTKAVHALAQKPLTNASGLPIVGSIGADGTIRLWQPTIGRMMRFRRLPSSLPLALAWTFDGETLLVADDKGAVHTIDYETLETLATLDAKTARTTNLVLSPDGKTALVGGSDFALKKFLLPE
jgi:WD40 repeat protein